MEHKILTMKIIIRKNNNKLLSVDQRLEKDIEKILRLVNH